MKGIFLEGLDMKFPWDVEITLGSFFYFSTTAKNYSLLRYPLKDEAKFYIYY